MDGRCGVLRVNDCKPEAIHPRTEPVCDRARPTTHRLRALFGIGHDAGRPRWHGHNAMTTITDQDTQSVNGIIERNASPDYA